MKAQALSHTHTPPLLQRPVAQRASSRNLMNVCSCWCGGGGDDGDDDDGGDDDDDDDDVTGNSHMNHPF